jgi:hypothetical protein
METLYFTEHNKLQCSRRKKKKIRTTFNASNEISAARYFYPEDGGEWSPLIFSNSP